MSWEVEDVSCLHCEGGEFTSPIRNPEERRRRGSSIGSREELSVATSTASDWTIGQSNISTETTATDCEGK